MGEVEDDDQGDVAGLLEYEPTRLLEPGEEPENLVHPDQNHDQVIHRTEGRT
jgi:hypothetical protein